MKELIFSAYGIEIFKQSNKYYIRYDAGEIACQMREDEITEEEAIKAQKSERHAYEVILASQRRVAGK